MSDNRRSICVGILVILLWISSACTPDSISKVRPVPDVPERLYAHLELTEAEAATLLSLQQLDDQPLPLYTMTYYAEYETVPFDTSALRSVVQLDHVPWTCSLFTALADPESLLFGRNFDWEYSPAVLVFTQPMDGYASVSMVDIAVLGYGYPRAETITDQPLEALIDLLAVVYLPFDGMNEVGLAVGMAAVPPGEMQHDATLVTIGSLGIIREVLDHAATVDQAVTLFERYNIDFTGGPPLHYLIADPSGRAVLVEFFQGEMIIVENESPWHQATNFLLSPLAGQTDGLCHRYDTIQERLRAQAGYMDTQRAMDLLRDVSQTNTMWSIVYAMSTGDIHVAMRMEYDEIHRLYLELRP